jgi:DNA-binding transcriptional LysR family regulator
MTSNQLTDLDLRLLRVMSALLDTGGVGRAAEALGVTPSAVSHSLAALRTRVGDQLFVRNGGSFSPTPRALAMQPRLQRALTDLRIALIQEVAFDPRTSAQQFSLSASDCIIEQLPNAVASIRRAAPHVSMRLLRSGSRLIERLASGELDLAIGYSNEESFLALDRDTMRVLARTDRLVCILRPDHPALRDNGLDLHRYLRLSHVSVSLSDRTDDVVDRRLEAIGKHRRIVLTVTDATAAVQCVASSDLAAIVPENTIGDAIAKRQVVSMLPPFEIPAADVYLWWHSRVHHEPSHVWWRGMILEHLGRAAPRRSAIQ